MFVRAAIEVRFARTCEREKVDGWAVVGTIRAIGTIAPAASIAVSSTVPIVVTVAIVVRASLLVTVVGLGVREVGGADDAEEAEEETEADHAGTDGPRRWAFGARAQLDEASRAPR